MWLSIEYWFLFRIFIGQWNDGNYDRKRIRNQKLRVAGIGGPLRAGFDAGIGRETVVQMGGGRPGVRDGAAGLRLAEREEDVDTPTGEDNRAVFGWALKQGTSAYETRDFGVSNHGVREVKDRTSGCERRDFSRSCRVFAGLKRGKEMSLYIY